MKKIGGKILNAFWMNEFEKDILTCGQTYAMVVFLAVNYLKSVTEFYSRHPSLISNQKPIFSCFFFILIWLLL